MKAAEEEQTEVPEEAVEVVVDHHTEKDLERAECADENMGSLVHMQGQVGNEGQATDTLADTQAPGPTGHHEGTGWVDEQSDVHTVGNNQDSS